MRTKNIKYNSKISMNRNLLKFLFILNSVFLILHSATAQTVGNDEVLIIKEHEAKVKDADKIMLSPNIPDIEETKPKLDYSIPTRDFKDISFEPNPLKPIGMSKEKMEKFNTSYIKFGFGSQLTPLAELAYNDNKTKNLKFGIFYDHLSQYAFSRKNQKFSDDKVGVYLKYYPKTFELGTNISFHNLRTHFYGYSDTTFESKAVRQEFRSYDADVYLKNAQKNQYDIDFNTGVKFNYFQETAGKGYEYFINGNVSLSKSFLKVHSVSGGFEFDYSQYKSTGQDVKRNLYFLNVAYHFNNDDWKATGKITLGVDGSKVYALPDIYLEKRLYEYSLIAYAGWDIRFQKNSFKSLAERNNFVLSELELQNTRVSDIRGGLKGTISSFSYDARFSFKNISNMPFYYTSFADNKKFYVGYDSRVKALNGHLELGYNLQDEFRILLSADYNSYTLTNTTRAWYEPAFKANLKASYNIQKKFIIGADIYGFTSYYGLVNATTEKKIKGTADISLSLEYLFSKRLSFFGMINNLAHQRYERWANYPVYGVNGLVGAKFSF